MSNNSMDEEINIVYLNKKVKMLKYNIESKKRFDERIIFIQCLEKNKIIWNDAHSLSKIWFNIKFNNCKYSPQIYKKYIYYNNLIKS